MLVGATNGGQASNLCTYMARGDVALSVLMTTSTTLGCIVMTPLICKLALGAVIPVDAIGISISTVQVGIGEAGVCGSCQQRNYLTDCFQSFSCVKGLIDLFLKWFQSSLYCSCLVH